MATCHLITHTDLTLLSNIYFCHLDNTSRKLITNGNSKLLTLQFRIQFFIFLDEIHHQVANHTVSMLITGPVTQLDRSKVKWIKIRCTELRSLSNHFRPQVVFHALRNLAFCQSHQFLNQNAFQVCNLRFKLIINLRQQCLVCQLRATVLDHTWEQFLIDNNAFQRRRCLQRSVLHITGLITKDRTKQFFFGRRIRFTFRSNLTDHDITRLDTGTDSYDTVFVQVLSCLFTDVRDIRSQFFHTTLRFTNFERIFFYVNWSQQVFTYNALVQYNSILIVISLPRHISHQQVLTQCQLTLFCRITFGQDITLFHPLALVADRTQVNRHVLVSLTELRYSIFLQSRFETYKFFVFRTVIQNTDSSSIHIVNHTIAFCSNLGTRVSYQLTFDTCTYDWSFTSQQRNRLAHHVRSHQCTVSIVMFQEWNQRSCNRCNLLRSNVHQVNFRWFNNREICILTRLHPVKYECTIVIQRSISLRNNLFFLFFSSQINQTVIRKIHFPIFHLAVGSFNES